MLPKASYERVGHQGSEHGVLHLHVPGTLNAKRVTINGSTIGSLHKIGLAHGFATRLYLLVSYKTQRINGIVFKQETDHIVVAIHFEPPVKATDSAFDLVNVYWAMGARKEDIDRLLDGQYQAMRGQHTTFVDLATAAIDSALSSVLLPQ